MPRNENRRSLRGPRAAEGGEVLGLGFFVAHDDLAWAHRRAGDSLDVAGGDLAGEGGAGEALAGALGAGRIAAPAEIHPELHILHALDDTLRDVGEAQCAGVDDERAGAGGDQRAVDLGVAADAGEEPVFGDDRRLLRHPQAVRPLAARADGQRQGGGPDDADGEAAAGVAPP
ncbi:hypothetical protein [Salinarimonas sp.]|uniref:hypothetical protein n=1 Tax=Salinarimonas sp. TaxID=2766526 RepID=UPI00391B85C1